MASIHPEGCLKKFLTMCRSLNCRPAVDKLIYFDNWITPPQEKWRYDTHFFLAINDVNENNIIISSETPAFDWFYPVDALNNYNNRNITLPPPTWYLINVVSKYPKLKDFIDYSKNKVIVPQRPEMCFDENKIFFVALSGDAKNGGDPESRNRIILSDFWRIENNLSNPSKSNL